jgi:hypothetical protein
MATEYWSDDPWAKWESGKVTGWATTASETSGFRISPHSSRYGQKRVYRSKGKRRGKRVKWVHR